MLPRQRFESYGPLAQVDPGVVFCARCGGKLGESPGSSRRGRACVRCGAPSYDNPKPAVSILVVRDSKFLLCRRSERSFLGDKWCLPCGFVEYGEDFLRAARREAKEETGLDVRVVSILSVVSNFLSPSVHSMVAVVLAEDVSGEVAAPDGDEIADVKWLAAGDELPAMAFEADAHIIKRYFGDRSLGVPVDPDFASPT